jgi:hypothetical protein
MNDEQMMREAEEALRHLLSAHEPGRLFQSTELFQRAEGATNLRPWQYRFLSEMARGNGLEKLGNGRGIRYRVVSEDKLKAILSDRRLLARRVWPEGIALYEEEGESVIPEEADTGERPVTVLDDISRHLERMVQVLEALDMRVAKLEAIWDPRD